MITAEMALEALRNSMQELADTNLAEAQGSESESLAKAEALGAYGAYQAIAKLIDGIRAKGFLEIDPRKVLDAQIEDIGERKEAAHRSFRMRQSIAHLSDMHREFWETLTGATGLTQKQLIEADPVAAYIMLNWTVLSSITSEWKPEEQAHTDEMLANMHRLIETTKQGILAALGNAGRMGNEARRPSNKSSIH